LAPVEGGRLVWVVLRGLKQIEMMEDQALLEMRV